MPLDIIKCNSVQFANLTPEVGQVVFIQDDEENGQLLMWSGTEWTEVKTNSNSEITMTAYEMNQQLISQMPALTDTELIEKSILIDEFCSNTNNTFYMLLCRDTNYYTVLHRIGRDSLDYASKVVIDCAETQGTIKSIEPVEGAIEIWVSSLTDTYTMYFFPYDGGVEVCR